MYLDPQVAAAGVQPLGDLALGDLSVDQLMQNFALDLVHAHRDPLSPPGYQPTGGCCGGGGG